jgi:signal transduction histidine kinase
VVDVSYKGVWLGYNRSVEFSIRQAFWKTWWFLLLSTMAIIMVFYSLYVNRKQQKEKQLQIRLKIASDLHDDVGSTLSSISIMSDLLQSRLDDSPNAEEMLRKIGNNARNMLESMDDIIWSVNPQNDNFYNIIVRIREYAMTLFEPLDIKFTIEVPENITTLQVPMDVRRNLFLIAKEAMNNAAKYSGCTEAIIDFAYSHSVLKMTITDNGKGFDTSKEYGRNGLRNMQYRGEKIGGKVTIRSTIGKGTTVTFTSKVG